MATNRKTLIRAARALAAGGILALATAVPAAAGQAPRVMLPDPVGNRALSAWREAAQAQHADGFEFDELGLGALAGLALAGAGAAAMRARRHHAPMNA